MDNQELLKSALQESWHDGFDVGHDLAFKSIIETFREVGEPQLVATLEEMQKQSRQHIESKRNSDDQSSRKH